VSGTLPSRASGPRSWTVRGPRGPFRWTAYVLAVSSFSAAIPTPLYPLYASEFHFSASVLGLVFASYTPGVLLTILLVAPQADRIGRKNLLGAGMGFAILGAAVFAFAPGVLWLALARFLAGVAVGATTSVATAAMTDLEPYHDAHHVARVAVAANFGGFAVGAVVSGVLVAYGPWSTHLVYGLPVAAGVVGLLGLRTTPETAPDLGVRTRQGIQRISVPAEVRRPFWVAAGGVAACYSIYGLFAALVPSYVRTGLHLPNPAVAGAIVALMFGMAALTQLGTAQLRDRRALLVGFPALLLALVGLVLVLTQSSWEALALVAGVLGVAVGLTFMGSATLVDRVAPSADRGEILAGFYSAGYLSVAIPTIGVGVLSGVVGLADAGIGLGSVLAGMAALLYWETYRTPTPPGGGGRDRSLGPPVPASPGQ
jgi:MFS family permease